MFPAPLGARDILNNISLNTPSFHNDQRLLLSIRHRNQTFIFIILNKIGTDTHAASSFILFYFVCEIPHSCDLKNGINPFVMLYIDTLSSALLCSVLKGDLQCPTRQNIQEKNERGQGTPGRRRYCDVESTSMTLIQRRNNVVCPVGYVGYVYTHFGIEACMHGTNRKISVSWWKICTSFDASFLEHGFCPCNFYLTRNIIRWLNVGYVQSTYFVMAVAVVSKASQLYTISTMS